MARIDHHLHTSRHSPDSSIDPLDLIEHARDIGLDALVITDHDYQWEPDELADLNARADGLKVFSGAEVSAREGHFLVYGLPDLSEAPAGITLADLLGVVRRHGAAIVAAHPFRWDQDFNGILAEHGPAFHALELVSNNVTSDTRKKTHRALDAFPSMGATGSSDGHELSVIGCYHTQVPGPVETLADFVAALHAGRVRPRHRPGVRLTSGPVAE